MPSSRLKNFLRIGRGNAGQPARSLDDVPGGRPVRGTPRRGFGDHRDMTDMDLDDWLDNVDAETTMRMLLRYGRLAELFQSATAIGETRVERYREYDQMADSSIISSYLEMLVDDASQQSHEHGRTIWPDDDCPHKAEIDALFEELRVEENVWGWMYTTAKYGDFFMRNEREPGVGVKRVRDDYHPSEVWRIDVNGRLLGFAYQENIFSSDATYAYGVGIQPAAIVGPSDFVHFMLNYKPHFDKIRVRLPRKISMPDGELDYSWYRELVDAAEPVAEEQFQVLQEQLDRDDLPEQARSEARDLMEWMTERSGDPTVERFDVDVEEDGAARLTEAEELDEWVGTQLDPEAEEKGDYVYVVVTAKYGSSSMHNARKDYKILNLVEQSLALARLSRSPVARVFYVNTEGANVTERKEMIEYIERKFSQNESFDASRDLYKDSYVPLGWSDDIVIPVAGAKGDVNVDQIGGDVDVKSIVDIDYFLNKVFSALRVPKSFMGYEEMLPGLSASKSLTMLDIRYARSAKKLQRSFITGMQRLCQIHLETKLDREVPLDELDLNMVSVSSAEEQERVEVIGDRVAMITEVANLVEEAGGNKRLAVKDMLRSMSDVFSLVEMSDDWFEAPEEPEEPEVAPGEFGGEEFGGEEELPPLGGPEEEVGPGETAEPALGNEPGDEAGEEGGGNAWAP